MANFELVIPESAIAEIDAKTEALRKVTAIEDDWQSRDASDNIEAGKKRVKAVNAERMALTHRIDAVKKVIMDREKQIVSALKAEIERVSALQVAYLDRKRAETEAAQNEALALAAESGEAPDESLLAETGKVVGVKSREYWGFRIVDGAKVPRQFCVPDEKLIRAYMQQQKEGGHDVTDIRVDGVEFYKETRV